MELGLTWVLGFGLDVCPLVVWDSVDILWIFWGYYVGFWGYYVGSWGYYVDILGIFWGYYVADYLRYVLRDKIVMKNKDYKIIE